MAKIGILVASSNNNLKLGEKLSQLADELNNSFKSRYAFNA